MMASYSDKRCDAFLWEDSNHYEEAKGMIDNGSNEELNNPLKERNDSDQNEELHTHHSLSSIKSDHILSTNLLGKIEPEQTYTPDINDKKQEHHDCYWRKRKRCDINSHNCDMKFQGSGLTCIGILPGVGSCLDSSDDSDHSCSSASDSNENIKYDLVGRRIVYECKEGKR